MTMTTSILSPLEQIVLEFNRGEERNPVVLLDLINQYYDSNGKQPVSHLDEITGEHATQALGNIFGFNRGNPLQARQRFVDNGIFSPYLSKYEQEVQDKVIENIINNISVGNWTSSYLSKDNPYVENNKQIIARSKKIKEYILSKVSHLDEITSDSGLAYTSKLTDIFGFNRGNPLQARQKFADNGIFPQDLTDNFYGNIREDICQNLIDNLSYSEFNSYYALPTLEESILQSNRETILASNAVQTFFAEQGYDMNELSTMNNKVRAFFRKYMGAEDIGRVIPPINVGSGRGNGNLPSYRKIQKEWAKDEEGFLIDLFTRDADGNETVFVGMLGRQRHALEDLLGVSYSAVINKCQYMGLLQRDESSDTRETGIPVYAFPDIHRQEFGDLLTGFQNGAFLLAHNIVPAVTQVFAYKSVSDERDEFPDKQFEHVTLPVSYRGVDINAYTQAEQSVISAVQHYISDNGRFPRNERGDVIIDPTTEHGFEPRILQIRGTPNNLTQLTFRRRLNPTNELRTAAIGIGHGREVYLFQHELHPTYQNTRAR